MVETPHRRPPPSLKIKCKSATLEDFLAQFGQDISRRGVFVKTKSPLDNGTALRFEFLLANATPAFSGIGKVVWRRHGTTGELPNGMGIQFIDLPDESRQLVERVATARVGMVSRFDQQNDADIDPAALRASMGATPEGAPATAPAEPPRAPSLPRGLTAASAPPPRRGSPTAAAGLFRQTPATGPASTAKPGAVPAAPPAAGLSSRPPPAAGAQSKPPPASPPAGEARTHPAGPSELRPSQPGPSPVEQPVGSTPPPLPRRSTAPDDVPAAADSSGLRLTPLPEAPGIEDLEARAAVAATPGLERGSLLPTGSLDETAEDLSDDFSDLGRDYDATSEPDGESLRPSVAPTFEEKLASLAPPPPSRAKIATAVIIVLLLGAAAAYFAMQGERGLEPILELLDRF